MKSIFLTLICLIIFLNNPKCLYSQWIELNSGVTSGLTSVSVPEYLYPTCWICGNNGIVLKTAYSFPITFRQLNNGIPSNINLINIFAVDSSRALTAGNIGSTTYVYRTTNGGYNWSAVFSQTNGFINAVWMRNASQGIMVGNPVGGRWSIWRTSTGGANWDSTGMYLPQIGNESGWPNSLFFRDSLYFMDSTRKLWFGTNNMKVYYSTNLGFNWIPLSTSPEANSSSILFNAASSSYGLFGGSTLMRTTNFGFNWINVPGILGSGNITGLAGNNPGVDMMHFYSWYLRNDNKIYYTSNAGFNWVVQYSAPSGNYKYVSQQRPGGFGHIFAVRDNGGISYCSCEPMGIKKTNTLIPDSYFLHQNYPNPFNPSTKIKFDIPPSKGARGMTRLIIYDVIGREVATLVSEQLQPGTYEVEWDGTNYPSGVYFYKLIVSDPSASSGQGYSETKKMVLLK